MRKVMLLLLLFTAGCSVDKSPQQEHTGLGYVRTVDTYRRIILHETDDGYLKQFNYCFYYAPVWQGMHVDIYFHWESIGECYKINKVERIGPDAMCERK